MQLVEEIKDYWNGRATTYSNGVKGELDDERRLWWEREFESIAKDVLDTAQGKGRPARVLDIGCGPGFFSVLFAARRCAVDAIDGSEEMLARARSNVSTWVRNANVAFHLADFQSLPFADNTFDLAVARNVTWLMRDPLAAYAEWLRVMRPGGKLVVFDSNWYLYLVDPALAEARRADMENTVLENWDEEARASADEEKRCEEIALRLPMTSTVRPAWDLKALANLGASQVSADEDAWKRLWTKSEQSYYRSTPMFRIVAVK